MRIIDFHTHPAYNTTKQYGYDMTDTLFVEELSRAGITMACGSAIEMDIMSGNINYGECIRKLNMLSWEYAEKYPEFFVPGIHIHPDFVEDSIDEILHYSQKGLKLVGELVPYLMGGCVDADGNVFCSKGFMELFDLCNQLGLTVSLHTSTVAECSYLAETFKTMNIVMAHPLYGEKYDARLEVVKKHENLFLDISGTGIAAYGMLRHGVDVVGREKIVFGTDFPGYNPEMYVRSVFYEKLSDTEREHIFYKNACRLLDIK